MTKPKPKAPPPDPAIPLFNPRHEAFVREMLKGATATDAYVTVGFKRSPHNANRTLKLPAVQARYRHLQSKAANRTMIRVENIVDMLMEDRSIAKNKRQAAAMVSATMGLAKVLGLIVDKSVQYTKKIDDMTEDELRALLGDDGDGD